MIVTAFVYFNHLKNASLRTIMLTPSDRKNRCCCLVKSFNSQSKCIWLSIHQQDQNYVAPLKSLPGLELLLFASKKCLNPCSNLRNIFSLENMNINCRRGLINLRKKTDQATENDRFLNLSIWIIESVQQAKVPWWVNPSFSVAFTWVNFGRLIHFFFTSVDANSLDLDGTDNVGQPTQDGV